MLKGESNNSSSRRNESVIDYEERARQKGNETKKAARAVGAEEKGGLKVGKQEVVFEKE